MEDFQVLADSAQKLSVEHRSDFFGFSKVKVVLWSGFLQLCFLRNINVHSFQITDSMFMAPPSNSSLHSLNSGSSARLESTKTSMTLFQCSRYPGSYDSRLARMTFASESTLILYVRTNFLAISFSIRGETPDINCKRELIAFLRWPSLLGSIRSSAALSRSALAATNLFGSLIIVMLPQGASPKYARL